MPFRRSSLPCCTGCRGSGEAAGKPPQPQHHPCRPSSDAAPSLNIPTGRPWERRQPWHLRGPGCAGAWGKWQLLFLILRWGKCRCEAAAGISSCAVLTGGAEQLSCIQPLTFFPRPGAGLHLSGAPVRPAPPPAAAPRARGRGGEREPRSRGGGLAGQREAAPAPRLPSGSRCCPRGGGSRCAGALGPRVEGPSARSGAAEGSVLWKGRATQADKWERPLQGRTGSRGGGVARPPLRLVPSGGGRGAACVPPRIAHASPPPAGHG